MESCEEMPGSFQKGVKRVKRVKAACICQTLHFMLKEDLGHDYAAKLVKEEVARYLSALDRSRTQYKIVSETVQPDGSIVMDIIKQYNQCNVGDYLK